MKITKNKLSLEEGLTKEWIITNGIGGFASSTVLGANTRKYHGLLVAPLTPPARRFLVLSKVDESVELDGRKYILYTNICQNSVSEGFKNLESFEKQYIPTFTYQMEKTKIEKSICMDYGKNTVCLLYKIKNGDAHCKFTLAPIVNDRDFHSMNTNHIFDIKQTIKDRKVKIVVDGKSDFPLYMNCTDGTYIKHENDTFFHMFYLEEEKRGFYPEENHVVVGRYEIEVEPNEEKEISFVFSMEENIEEIRTQEIIKKEKQRLDTIIGQTNLLATAPEKELTKIQKEKEELLKSYIIATDNFVVDRPSFGLHTIIAGYPWFLDWGRDSLIAFEGLLLVTKRYEIAKEVLLTFIRDIKFGLVPNGYSGYDNRPLYNSVDASLLLFEEIYKYLKYTNDYSFVKEHFFEVLVKIVDAYTEGIDVDDNNIYLDRDGLIHSGTENTQNTWMDAKVEGFAVTPRSGKAVEINSMWYNALRILEELTTRFETKERAEKYTAMAEKCQKSFKKKFYNKQKNCLYDVLGDDKIRPNQLFSLALSYPVVDPSTKMAKEIIETVKEKLYTKHGLKTLAKGEENYIEVYEGDGFKRDSSYHQGITWPWLFGIYYNALKQVAKTEKVIKRRKEFIQEIEKFRLEVEKVFKKAMIEEGCLGSIAELYDSKTPFLPKGAFAQAWSVAEIFRILMDREIIQENKIHKAEEGKTK